MYFETMKEFYDKTVAVSPLDCEDIIVLEKGRAIYDTLQQNRRELEEQRKIREIIARDPHNFNQDEERKKTQER